MERYGLLVTLDQYILKEEVMDLLETHKEFFGETFRQIRATEHPIAWMLDTQPVRLSPYRTGPENLEEIQKQIEYPLKTGEIEPSQTEWPIPVLLALKKDYKGGSA